MRSQTNFKLFSQLALLALALPAASFCTSIQALGTTGGPTVCEVGASCPEADSTGTAIGIPPASLTATGNYNFTYTFTNGDVYSVIGSFSNSYATATDVNFDPNVTFVGNGASHGVAAGADILSLTMFQSFYDNTPGSWDGSYCEKFPVTVAAGGSADATWSVDGQAVGTLTAGPGSSEQSTCKSLSFTNAQNSSSFLDTAYVLNFDFSKGTTPGSTTVSATPEPAQTIPTAISLFCGAAFLIARRTRNSRCS